MNMHVQTCVGGAGDLALHFLGDLFAHTRQESQSNCVHIQSIRRHLTFRILV